jgi:hypothetical protein
MAKLIHRLYDLSLGSEIVSVQRINYDFNGRLVGDYPKRVKPITDQTKMYLHQKDLPSLNEIKNWTEQGVIAMRCFEVSNVRKNQNDIEFTTNNYTAFGVTSKSNPYISHACFSPKGLQMHIEDSRNFDTRPYSHTQAHGNEVDTSVKPRTDSDGQVTGRNKLHPEILRVKFDRNLMVPDVMPGKLSRRHQVDELRSKNFESVFCALLYTM